jgi:hypothetical protein
MNFITKQKIRFLPFKRKKKSSMFKRHKLCALNIQFFQAITQLFNRKSHFFVKLSDVMCLRSFAKQKTSNGGYFSRLHRFRGCCASLFYATA